MKKEFGKKLLNGVLILLLVGLSMFAGYYYNMKFNNKSTCPECETKEVECEKCEKCVEEVKDDEEETKKETISSKKIVKLLNDYDEETGYSPLSKFSSLKQKYNIKLTFTLDKNMDDDECLATISYKSNSGTSLKPAAYEQCGIYYPSDENEVGPLHAYLELSSFTLDEIKDTENDETYLFISRNSPYGEAYLYNKNLKQVGKLNTLEMGVPYYDDENETVLEYGEKFEVHDDYVVTINKENGVFKLYKSYVSNGKMKEEVIKTFKKDEVSCAQCAS